ncbi:MAG: aminopeptidase P family protein [Nannocystales bacterium]
MSGQLPVQSPQVFSNRRSALCSALGNQAAVIFSGGQRSRNYPANVYPYRADSHFLYLVGAGMPEAALILHAGRCELFIIPPDADDALWHGASPSLAAIGKATGVDAVRPLSELTDALQAAGEIGTLPSADPQTRAKQCALLGRTWDPARAPSVDNLDELDLTLADAMIELRLRHDPGAIDMIRSAVEATTAAHRAGMAVTKPGLLEHDIRAAMERELLARGCEPAYGSIVTVHGEVLHNTEYHHRLGPSDLLLADLGGEHRGWASDVTRTWPVQGRFSATQRALYDIVLQAEKEACAMVKPGARYRDIHLHASLVLARGLVDEGILRGDPEGLVERGAHALLFPHGVGHVLGLDVHDMEDLGDRAGYAQGRTRSDQFGLGFLRLDRDLEPGMVVTIEPGIYLVPAILESERIAGPFLADGTLNKEALARFADVRGIRIEDDVLCTDAEPEILSAAIPKEIADVEAAVGTPAS